MEETIQDKLSLLEMLRTALPRGLSSGDGGLGNFPQKRESHPMQWPEFRVQNSESKLYGKVAPSEAAGSTIINAPTFKFPLQLELVSVNDSQYVRVYASTIAGGTEVGAGFSFGDDPPLLFSASSGYIQAKVTIDGDGAVISRSIEKVTSLSEDTATDFHCLIGVVSSAGQTFNVGNSRYGPIDAVICRDWFSNPPKYSVTFVSPSMLAIP